MATDSLAEGAPSRVGSFTTKNGHGIALFVKGNEVTDVSLSIPEAQAIVATLVQSLTHAKRRRDAGEWTDERPCRHGTDMQGRIEHALFYAMRDEYEDECIDEYCASYASAVLDELGLTDERDLRPLALDDLEVRE